MPQAHEYRFRVGKIVISLEYHDLEFVQSLAEYFMQPSDPAEPDVRLELNLVNHEDMPEVPNSLILTKSLTDDGFDIADGLIRGHFDPVSGRGELHVKTILTNGLMTRVFEQILYQAFHSACQRAGYDASLVHSSGVIHSGAGFLFVGPSEAGKSTVASLSLDRTVLNDEMNLIDFSGDTPQLISTGFNGHYRDKQSGSAPLTAVLLLSQGPTHALEPVSLGSAACTIAAQIAPAVGLDQLADQATRQAMLDTGIRLAESVPNRRLVFLPDAGFWPLLVKTFISVNEG